MKKTRTKFFELLMVPANTFLSIFLYHRKDLCQDINLAQKRHDEKCEKKRCKGIESMNS